MNSSEAHRHEGTKPRRAHTLRAFTLTEILVVIGIVVLMMALAVPAFNIIRGSRSVEAAENELSALIARARTEAIGNQKTTGVFFFRDPRNPDQISCAEVWESDLPSIFTGTAQVYLDLAPEREFLLLPPGVGLQMVDDCNVQGGVRQDDGYIGYNTKVRINGAAATDTITSYGGVVLFDSNGRLTCQTYGFRIRSYNPTVPGFLGDPTQLGDLLYYDVSGRIPNPNVPQSEFIDPGNSTIAATAYPRSQFGLVVFDAVAFKTADGTPDDPQLTSGTYNLTEYNEENWLDTHGTPLLVDRFNGTLNTMGQ